MILRIFYQTPRKAAPSFGFALANYLQMALPLESCSFRNWRGCDMSKAQTDRCLSLSVSACGAVNRTCRTGSGEIESLGPEITIVSIDVREASDVRAEGYSSGTSVGVNLAKKAGVLSVARGRKFVGSEVRSCQSLVATRGARALYAWGVVGAESVVLPRGWRPIKSVAGSAKIRSRGKGMVNWAQHRTAGSCRFRTPSYTFVFSTGFGLRYLAGTWVARRAVAAGIRRVPSCESSLRECGKPAAFPPDCGGYCGTIRTI
jgi:hypothetical protein